MKKLLSSSLVILITCFTSIACDFPIVTSSCIKASFHGTETIQMSFTGLCSPSVYIWVHTGSGMTSADFLELSSSSPMVAYPGVGTYLFPIIPTQIIPLNQCYDVYTGTTHADAPFLAYNPVFYSLCACVTGACYIDDPNAADPLIVDLFSPSAGPTPLYLWIDNGYGPDGGFPTTGGTFNGSDYDHLVSCNDYGIFYNAYEFAHGCIPTIYVSDVFYDPLTGSSDPANTDDWTYSFSPICPCPPKNITPSKYVAGCIYTDPSSGIQTVTVQTDNNITQNYMWYEGVSGMATQISIAANAGPGLPWIVTFNFSTIGGGIGITPGCHNFYFSNTPTDPRPGGTRILICPCGELPPANTQYYGGCLNIDASYWATVTVETNNGTTPNYMWFEGMGMAVQFGPAVLNPLYPGTFGELKYIVTFDFATIGLGISPTITCHNYCFSATPVYPGPTVSMIICPCSKGNPDNRSSNGISGNTSNNMDAQLSEVLMYPNPANENSIIEFNLQTASMVQIDVTDQSGRTITSIANQRMEAGNRKIDFSTVKLADGVYIVRIKSDKMSVNKMLTIVR